MRFIVSPAKKMNRVDDAFEWRDKPIFLERTKVLAREVGALSYGEAKALWGCSDALAELNHARFCGMDLHSDTLTPAILAYEGIQYQHMAPHVMDSSQLDYLQKHLRILSGFYGVLRPLDGVVPYRLEMQAKLAVDGAKDLYAFWGEDIFQYLAGESDVIVNLASLEYAKAVIPHMQRPTQGTAMPCRRGSEIADVQRRGPECSGATLITCLFGSVENDRLVQRSTAAKAARGSMVRWCAEHNIQQSDDLRAFDVAEYAYDESRSTKDVFVFVK